MATPKTTSTLNRLYDLDLTGCVYLNQYCRRKIVKDFFSAVSRLGDGVFWYSLGAVLPFLYGFYGAAITLVFALTGLTCLVVYKSIKHKFYRERPYLRSNKIIRGCAPLDFCSFPSGHTMHAVGFTTVVVWFFPEFVWILVPFACLVAASRMILGLHYPSDVLIGASIGLLIAISFCLGFEDLLIKHPELNTFLT